MKARYLLFILLCWMSSCRNDTSTCLTEPSLHITGDGYPAFSSGTRSQPEMDSFVQGEQIIFFSKGGISAEGIILTYNGTTWTPETPLQWTGDEAAEFTAAYPAMQPNSLGVYDVDSLYDKNGKLKDILFCQGSSGWGQDIRLEFSHRFSQLNVCADDGLNKEIEETSCTTTSISSLDPRTGILSYQPSSLHEEKSGRNEEGLYSFIIPPTGDTTQDVELVFHMQDDSRHTNTLSGNTFKPGTAYICHATDKGNLPGIYNAEDFIAFSHLINDEEYEGRTLDEFGETIDGRSTYYLRSDIAFTPDESDRLVEIGYGNQTLPTTEFADIFDGLGHTLSGITLDKKTTSYKIYGIFGEVDTTGIIRNLKLDNITYQQNGNIGYSGILAGENKGHIYNCVMTNCQIKTDSEESTSEDIGGLTACNTGMVYNCQVDNLTMRINNKKWSGPGIIKANYGYILNCSVSNIYFTNVSTGGFLCHSNSNIIQNCNIYKKQESKINAFCLNNYGTINFCYYPDNFTSKPIQYMNPTGKADIEKYDAGTFLVGNDEEPLHEVLNRWIDEVGLEKYPDIEFMRWEKGETLPAVLVMP